MLIVIVLVRIGPDVNVHWSVPRRQLYISNGIPYSIARDDRPWGDPSAPDLEIDRPAGYCELEAYIVNC